MLEYLKNHIIEELKGAEDYWQKALENKSNEWGHLFHQMAEMELEHANALTKIFNKTDKPKSVTDKEYGEKYEWFRKFI